MYLDTKNFGVNAPAQNTTAATTETQKTSGEKFKLKKVWRPFVRLISKNGKKTNSAHLPNNVNLNNSANVIAAKKDLYFGEEQQQQQQEHNDEQYPETMHKLTQEECWRRLTATVDKDKEDDQQHHQFIKSASVEKTPLNTCSSTCVYGRNCQHTQYHKLDHDMELSNLSSNPSATHHYATDNSHTFNYVGAEDGCFVWSESMEDLDTIMLREWLLQNSWQYAKNATMC